MACSTSTKERKGIIVKVLAIVEGSDGTITFALNDVDALQVEVDLTMKIPEGDVQFKGFLDVQEVAFNIKHSLMHLAMQGALPFQVINSGIPAKLNPELN